MKQVIFREITLGEAHDKEYILDLTNHAPIKNVIIGPGVDLTDAHLTNTDLTNMDLTGIIWTNTTLTGVKAYNIITGTETLPANYTWVEQPNLQNGEVKKYAILGPDVDLTDADLTDVTFTAQVNLTNANLTNVTIAGLTSNGHIIPADGVNIDLDDDVMVRNGYLLGPGVDLTDADLTNEDLTNVDLTNTTLTGIKANNITATTRKTLPTNYTWVEQPNLAGTKYALVGPNVDLTDANLTNADLTNMDLTGITWTNTILTGIKAYNIITGTETLPANYTWVEQPNLQNGEVKKYAILGPDVNLTDADLTDVTFTTQVNLTNANLTNATITGFTSNGHIIPITSTDINIDLDDGVMVRNGYLMGPGVNLTNANFTDMDLTNVNLTNATLTGIKAYNITVNGTETLPANYTWALQPNLTGTKYALVGPNVDLTDADLTNADLAGLDLTNVTWTGTTLTGIKAYNIIATTSEVLPGGYEWVELPRLHVSDVTKYVIIGHDVDLTGTDLTGTDLTSIDLTSAILNSIKAHDVIATGSETLPVNYTWVQQPNLEGAKYAIVGPNVDLTDADLSGVDLTGQYLPNVNWTNVNLTHVKASNININGNEILPTNYDWVLQPNLVGNKYAIVGPNVNLSNVDFDNADLNNQNLSGVYWPGISLNNTRTYDIIITENEPSLPVKYSWHQQSNLKYVIIAPNVDLSGANLKNLDLTGSDITGINLTNANLTNAITYNINASGNEPLPNDNYTWVEQSNLQNEDVKKYAIIGPNVNLSNINLNYADLTNVNFENVNLTDATIFYVQALGREILPTDIPGYLL